MEKEKLIPYVYYALSNGYMDKFEREGWRDSLYYIAGNLEDKFYLNENITIDKKDEYFKCMDKYIYGEGDELSLKKYEKAISQDYKKEHYQWLEDGYNRWSAHKINQAVFNEWFKYGKEIWPKYKELIEKENPSYPSVFHNKNESKRDSMRKYQCSSCGMSICEDDYIVHGCCPVCDENF
ncbi:MAG: hypothetical protein EKE20_14650 [Candidatus Symbiopectobacterium sp. Dall1.0]|nr:hypothetical protein [Candidatus Symbiopectobacterium sp. Dall1.0]